MNIIQKRFIYYLFGCIGTRTLLTLLMKKLDKNNRQLASIFTLIIACGFIYIYIFGSQRADNQLEWANAKVWWNDYRIIHGLLYLSFSITALFKLNKSWIFLALDTLLGLILFLYYHYTQGNL
jgi:hypothetical protein